MSQRRRRSADSEWGVGGQSPLPGEGTVVRRLEAGQPAFEAGIDE